MVGVLEPAPPLWLQRYEKSEPSMNIHGPAELNTSHKHTVYCEDWRGFWGRALTVMGAAVKSV